MHRKLPVLVAVVFLLSSSRHAEAKKIWSLSPDRGFVDDAMAFDRDARRFAYIHTDSARFLDIVLLDVASRKPKGTIKVDDPRRVPNRLAFTPDGGGLVLLWTDGYTGAYGAMAFDPLTGKLRKEVKGGDFGAITAWEGQQVVVLGQIKTDRRGGEDVHLTIHRTNDLKPVKKARVRVEPDGTLRRPKVRLLYWDPGRLSLVGMKRGAYDKKRDIRLPDLAVRFDPVRRKETWHHEIRDLIGWARATNMRAKHQKQHRFLQVSDDLKALHYVDRKNKISPVTTPVRWKLYEPKSLRQHETWDGKTLYFSMSIDPVNPEAVARKKADKERCDIYRLDPGPTPRPLGQVLTEKRKFTWVVGQGLFAYLFKLKGFGRGGKKVELHTID